MILVLYSTEYVDELMDLMFDHIILDPGPFANKVLEIPIPADLCAEFERPAKEDVIASYVSRFNLEAV